MRESSPAVTEDAVRVVVPAAGGWLGVLRTATAGLAARLGFSADQIEDLRIAVDEACAMLLLVSVHDGEVTCRFRRAADGLRVEVSAQVRAGAALPAASAFSWQVLAGLVDRLETESVNGSAMIRLIAAEPS